jgi:hypothetical protein
MAGSSVDSSTLLDERRERELDEQAFEQIDVAMLYIEEARARTERAAAEMRKLGAEQHPIDAMDQAQEELSDLARRLRQGTFFAVPKEQLKI